ncbi:hypothetical protein E1211_00020 [Micromonospora sp. 15K316]|uniref:hypothetical protein n=1 Tax=Micromonospora sp. 15K316 TaxID=2530376 RepID=UPI00104ECA63|nr:hypothetical protein [Micromonospora sp. 15K316]TDC40544.1 hypothetical protein E1211_00020 [Micromonospora sp. 15K316]
MHRLPALLAAPAVLAAAVTVTGCAGGDRTEPEPPTGGTTLVLRLSELPGLLPPGGAAALAPRYSLFGDGRLISAPTAAGGWPQLREDTVSADDVRELFRTAAALPDGPAAGTPDGPVVQVVVGAAGGRRTVTLARDDAAATRLRADLARHAGGPPTPYDPTVVAIVATPADPAEPARPWPLPTLAGEPLDGTSAGSTCLVLRGADLDTARRAVGPADAAARWRSAGRVWQVAPRPLLPDETGCADL